MAAPPTGQNSLRQRSGGLALVRTATKPFAQVPELLENSKETPSISLGTTEEGADD